MVATSLRALATAILCASLPLASASALRPRQQEGAVARPWISFDAEGHPSTYARIVTTMDGATTTLSAQPYSLTGTVFTLIDPAGTTYTTTGNSPPPRATDSSGGRGYFAQCNGWGRATSNIEPFCQPRAQAVLYEDTPYYITWDNSSFSADSNANVHIQLFNVSSDDAGSVTKDSEGVPLRTLGQDDQTKLSQGYFVWKPTQADLNGRNDFQNITIRISYNSSMTNSIAYKRGATVAVFPKDMKPEDVPAGEDNADDDEDDDSNSGGGGGGVPAAAIAVPIVVVVLALAGIAAFFLIRRRRREQAAGGGVPNRGSSAFGSRASGGSTQFNQKNNNDIELTTSPTSPRSGGGNVFQDEIERQNRERAT